MRKQQRDLNAGVTEDDLNEIKQDISGLRFRYFFFLIILVLRIIFFVRFELLEILKNNSFKVDVLKQNPG